ncbi:hypothetical protein EVAR_101939_1 [Eumeta japonica]|uniref:Uncharacterized protein n=1 Tax=Eumeta variegata TaxID=151549 RepID=A0A4C1TSD9_EUMVA|nr:hypothetical protein EVAR_101939_1 [Eumeta japonica]
MRDAIISYRTLGNVGVGGRAEAAGRTGSSRPRHRRPGGRERSKTRNPQLAEIRVAAEGGSGLFRKDARAAFPFLPFRPERFKAPTEPSTGELVSRPSNLPPARR